MRAISSYGPAKRLLEKSRAIQLRTITYALQSPCEDIITPGIGHPAVAREGTSSGDCHIASRATYDPSIGLGQHIANVNFTLIGNRQASANLTAMFLGREMGVWYPKTSQCSGYLHAEVQYYIDTTYFNYGISGSDGFAKVKFNHPLKLVLRQPIPGRDESSWPTIEDKIIQSGHQLDLPRVQNAQGVTGRTPSPYYRSLFFVSRNRFTPADKVSILAGAAPTVEVSTSGPTARVLSLFKFEVKKMRVAFKPTRELGFDESAEESLGRAPQLC